MGDIECYEQAHGILVEVTMAEGRTQTMMEIWPIERHLNDFIEREQLPSQALFIAPSIYADSQRQIEFVRFSSQRIIRPLAIDQFILFLDTAAALYVDA